MLPSIEVSDTWLKDIPWSSVSFWFPKKCQSPILNPACVLPSIEVSDTWLMNIPLSSVSFHKTDFPKKSSKPNPQSSLCVVVLPSIEVTDEYCLQLCFISLNRFSKKMSKPNPQLCVVVLPSIEVSDTWLTADQILLAALCNYTAVESSTTHCDVCGSEWNMVEASAVLAHIRAIEHVILAFLSNVTHSIWMQL